MNKTINQTSYKHLHLEEDNVIFLGYKLTLTKTEYSILKVLINSGNSPVSIEQLCEQTGLNLSKENVAFHVFSINKKAKIISNRVLIKNLAKNGYFLNEEM